LKVEFSPKRIGTSSGLRCKIHCRVVVGKGMLEEVDRFCQTLEYNHINKIKADN
jgi:hypothetical protein